MDDAGNMDEIWTEVGRLRDQMQSDEIVLHLHDDMLHDMGVVELSKRERQAFPAAMRHFVNVELRSRSFTNFAIMVGPIVAIVVGHFWH